MTDTYSSFSERWEDLTLANNFIFCKVMENNPDLCKKLLELLLHIKIDRLEKPQSEKFFQESLASKSVRFDVYTKDSKRIFDIEIQTINKNNLPRRSRYYQSIIDVNNLDSGVNYNELKDTYIIFICLNDLFKKGLPVYSFENICAEDNTLKLGDGTYKIFFNARECDKMKTAEEKAFFNFIKGSRPDTDFTRQLSEKLLLAKNNLMWRKEYMTFKEQFYEEFEEARKAGHSAGMKEGINEGRREGIEEGIKEGQLKKAEETALNAIKLGLAPEQISLITELPLEKVLSIKNDAAVIQNA